MHGIATPLLASLFLTTVHAQIPEPSAARMRHFARELDSLQKSMVASQRKSGTAAEEFILHASKRVADRNGPDILAAVMRRSRKWRGEEGIYFNALVNLLPRERATAILRAYERHGQGQERVWAREYLIEFEAEDTQEMVRRYRNRR